MREAADGGEVDHRSRDGVCATDGGDVNQDRGEGDGGATHQKP